METMKTVEYKGKLWWWHWCSDRLRDQTLEPEIRRYYTDELYLFDWYGPWPPTKQSNAYEPWS